MSKEGRHIMALRRFGKLCFNGVLLVILTFVTAVFVLNLVNPAIPALRCQQEHGLLEPSISHKFNGDTVTTITLLTCVIVVPVVQMLLTEWLTTRENPYSLGVVSTGKEPSRWRRTMVRLSRLSRDYMYGLALVLLLNDVAKTTLCAPRPHWLDSCKPNFTKEACQMGWLTDYECTNKDISRWKLADARKSFPSGHSALSFYAASFMGIYQHRSINWRRFGTLTIVWMHLLWFSFAMFCTTSRVADKRHHPVDVAFGGFLGSVGGIFMALIVCRGFRRSPASGGGAGVGGSPTSSVSNGSPYHNPSRSKVMSGCNGLLDSSGDGGSPLNGMNMNGGPKHVGNNEKRPSLRRLLSTQSNVTQMSDIAEDRELDSL